MAFHSVLFENDGDAQRVAPSAPACFDDLNLDQVVATITAPKQEYDLKPFFYTSLGDEAAICYRHAVMRDLEDKRLYDDLHAFAQAMRAMREGLDQAHKLHHKHQKARWLLDAVGIYCAAARRLCADLHTADLRSPGLLGFRQYVANYCAAASFGALAAATERLQARLDAVHYCLHIKDNTIKVRKYAGESDYAGEVAATFDRFAGAPGRDYRATFPAAPNMNHVEAQILNAVALLYTDVFGELDAWCAANSGYLDAVISRFDREIQFYIAYLDYMALFGRLGLKFCYPQVSAGSKETVIHDAYDLALAYKLLGKGERVVGNDFYLDGGERILVISGPNQGGKTTFARTCGQLHYLASLGCPVPAQGAQLYLCDHIFTHFESEENISDLRGKLADDLVRIHAILQQATPRSLIILNEIFSSTTLRDAILLGKRVLAAIVALDSLCVCVTFLDELAAFGPTTVSMVSTVAAHDEARRTFKLLRRPADGRAYAISIAEKYRLTYANLLKRIQP